MRGLHPTLPLVDTVLLPGMIARLQIARPASVAAVDFHLSTGRLLLTVPTRGTWTDEIGPDNIGERGCTATVLKTIRLGDGTMRVLLEGQGRVRVSGARFDPDVGLVASTRPLLASRGDPEKVELRVREARRLLSELLEADRDLPAPLRRLSELELSPGRLCDLAASNLTLPRDQALAYLSEHRVDERLSRLLVDLGREKELRIIRSRVRQRVQQTMDKQHRDFYLREQIRGLREELGEAPEGYNEVSALEKKLREAGMPAAGLEEALRELDRLRRMHPDAAEYTVSRTWLEWLTAMPWTSVTEDRTDLRAAAVQLDADHYGLEKVKERVLEYLAVRRLNPEGASPVLCFVGPPGVGKTSLGQSIAAALGRNFHRVSLGGVKDEAEIRGHRRTYVGALPGRIASALKRAASRNPVLVLDEIDKIGKDFRGDPSSALLEVLDPGLNAEFMDHYLDIPFDLSQVLFICTANLEGPIPPALRDRLELIKIAGYIQEEKLEIARRHLLPRLRTSHGVSAARLSITRRAIETVIASYTHEAGVRGLERELAAVHRKVARMVVEGRERGVRVDSAASVRRLLGPPRHFVELAERVDAPGVAVGLAWTEAGGDILFVEVTSFPAERAALKLTGQLGDVMKESGEAALSLLRTRATDLGIDADVFSRTLFHLHVPAGAIPKDGPSAGVTMLTALTSLITRRKARARVAMTGEVTLRGRVLPVGGIKEKVLAAPPAGVAQVILPRRNAGDLENVPELLRADLVFHPVDTVDEVLELALEPSNERELPD